MPRRRRRAGGPNAADAAMMQVIANMFQEPANNAAALERTNVTEAGATARQGMANASAREVEGMRSGSNERIAGTNRASALETQQEQSRGSLEVAKTQGQSLQDVERIRGTNALAANEQFNAAQKMLRELDHDLAIRKEVWKAISTTGTGIPDKMARDAYTTTITNKTTAQQRGAAATLGSLLAAIDAKKKEAGDTRDALLEAVNSGAIHRGDMNNPDHPGTNPTTQPASAGPYVTNGDLAEWQRGHSKELATQQSIVDSKFNAIMKVYPPDKFADDLQVAMTHSHMASQTLNPMDSDKMAGAAMRSMLQKLPPALVSQSLIDHTLHSLGDPSHAPTPKELQDFQRDNGGQAGAAAMSKYLREVSKYSQSKSPNEGTLDPEYAQPFNTIGVMTPPWQYGKSAEGAYVNIGSFAMRAANRLDTFSGGDFSSKLEAQRNLTQLLGTVGPDGTLVNIPVMRSAFFGLLKAQPSALDKFTSTVSALKQARDGKPLDDIGMKALRESIFNETMQVTPQIDAIIGTAATEARDEAVRDIGMHGHEVAQQGADQDAQHALAVDFASLDRTLKASKALMTGDPQNDRIIVEAQRNLYEQMKAAGMPTVVDPQELPYMFKAASDNIESTFKDLDAYSAAKAPEYSKRMNEKIAEEVAKAQAYGDANARQSMAIQQQQQDAAAAAPKPKAAAAPAPPVMAAPPAPNVAAPMPGGMPPPPPISPNLGNPMAPNFGQMGGM